MQQGIEKENFKLRNAVVFPSAGICVNFFGNGFGKFFARQYEIDAAAAPLERRIINASSDVAKSTENRVPVRISFLS